jgi:hypothetical protein
MTEFSLYIDNTGVEASPDLLAVILNKGKV